MAPGLRLILDWDVGPLIDGLNSAGERLAGIGTPLLIGLTAPLTALAVPALAAADSYRQAMAALRTSTQATGPQLEDLSRTYERVRSETGASMATATGVIGELHRRLGLTGDQLERAATAAATLLQSRGIADPTMIGGVARTLSAWDVPSHAFADTLGALAAAARGANGGVAGLADTLTRSAATFRAAGLDLRMAATAIANLTRHGISADTAITALTRAVSTLAATGQGAGALRGMIAQIRSAATPADAAAIAAELFGRQGVLLSDAIRAGALDFEKLMMRPFDATATEPLHRLRIAWGRLRAEIETLLRPIGRPLLDVLVLAAEQARVLAEWVGTAIAAFGRAPDWARYMVLGMVALVAIVGPALVLGGLIITTLGGLVFSVLQLVGVTTLLLGGALAMLLAHAVATLPPMAVATSAVESVSHQIGVSTAVVSTSGDDLLDSAIDAADTPLMIQRIVDKSSKQIRHTVTARRHAVAKAVTETPRWPNLTMPTVDGVARLGPQGVLRVEPKFLPVTIPTIPGPVTMPSIPVAPAMPVLGIPMDLFVNVREWRDLKLPTPVPPMPIYAPLPDRAPWDAMRAHAENLRQWFEALRGLGLLPPPPYLPGSWLDANRPSEWIRRANEDEARAGTEWARNVQARERWETEQRQRFESERFTRRTPPWGGPGGSQVVMTEDVLAALNVGWREAVGAKTRI